MKEEKKNAAGLTAGPQRLAEDAAKAAAKREEKSWRQKVAPRSPLAALLALLSKAELTALRQALGLVGVSSLRKQELADVVAAETLRRAPACLKLLDRQQYLWLQKVVAADGVYLVQPEEDELWLELEGLGWLFRGESPGGRTLFLPQELIALFGTLEEQGLGALAARNEEWLCLVRGLLYYYGVLSPAELEAQLTALTGQPLPAAELQDVLQWCCLYGGGDICSEDGFWCHWDVDDGAAVRREQLLRGDLEFRQFSYAQVQAAGQRGFVESHPALRQLVQAFQENWELDGGETDNLAAACVAMIRNRRDLPRWLKELGEALEFPDANVVQFLAQTLADVHNQLPQWSLKGYSPLELRQLRPGDDQVLVVDKPRPVAAAPKIGRNEPCPCGSGKKYKKCCGAG